MADVESGNKPVGVGAQPVNQVTLGAGMMKAEAEPLKLAEQIASNAKDSVVSDADLEEPLAQTKGFGKQPEDQEKGCQKDDLPDRAGSRETRDKAGRKVCRGMMLEDVPHQDRQWKRVGEVRQRCQRDQENGEHD